MQRFISFPTSQKKNVPHALAKIRIVALFEKTNISVLRAEGAFQPLTISIVSSIPSIPSGRFAEDFLPEVPQPKLKLTAFR